MEIKRLLSKSTFYFTGLFILVSAGLNIYQYKKIKTLSEKPVEKFVKNEFAKNREAASIKMVKKNELIAALPGIKKEEPDTGVIDELEYHLNASEEELDMAYKTISDELYKKAEFKKAMDEYAKNMRTNPAFNKMKKDSLMLTLSNDYDPLINRMNISKEEFDELKGILADQMMEIESVGAMSNGASTDEAKAEVNRKMGEIREKYENKIHNLLGEENKEIYQSYMVRLTDRRNLNDFMETLSPENKIDERQAEGIINSMYEARKEAYNEIMQSGKTDYSSGLTEDNMARMIERSERINEKCVESCENVLSPDQLGKFKTFLNQKLEIEKSGLKMSLYFNNIN